MTNSKKENPPKVRTKSISTLMTSISWLKHGFHQLFPSSLAGHIYGPFTRDNPLYITYHRVVFRPQHSEAQLTISDWKHDTDPGGPIGRQLMYNFIEVQPYFDGSISNPGTKGH